MASKTFPVALLRFGYRLANLAISIDRRIRNSHGRGVKFIVDGGERGLLLVRHTYGHRHWTLPGGRVRRGEAPLAAARRELGEELNLTNPDLIDLGSYPGRVHKRREQVSVFLADCHDGDPVANPIELAELGWFRENALPPNTDPTLPTSLGLLSGRRAEKAARSGRSAR